MIDPYFYRARLTMPTFPIHNANNQYETPDDNRLCYDDMPGPKTSLIIPNADGWTDSGEFQFLPSLGAYILTHLLNKPVPSVNWTINEKTGEIVAIMEDSVEAVEVNVWYAYSCGINSWDGGKLRRDFRITNLDNPCTCGIWGPSDHVRYNVCFNKKGLWQRFSIAPTILDGKVAYR